MARTQGLSRLHDFVARRENRHSWTFVHVDLRHADGRDRADAAGVERLSRGDDDLTRLNIRAPASDVLLRQHLGKNPHYVADCVSFFHHHDSVGPLGQRRARGYLDALSVADTTCRDLTRVKHASASDRAWMCARRAGGIARAHGVAVHASARKRWNVPAGDDLSREHAAGGLGEGNSFYTIDRRAGSIENGARGVERDDVAEGPHSGGRH